MNTTLLHRLAWKELRTLRALWLSLLVAAVVLQVGLMGFFEAHGIRWQWLCGVMLTLPSVYALACTSLTFAGEREEGTDQLLCRLGTPPGLLLGIKFGLSVLTTAVMFGLLYVWTMLLLKSAVPHSKVVDIAHELPNHLLVALAWTTGFLSFGLLFSLLFHRVLPCLLATAVAASVLPLVATVIVDWVLPGSGVSGNWLDWTIRLGVVPVLLVATSVWLAQTWDETRWPRIVERLLESWHALVAGRGRSVETSESARSTSGLCRRMLRSIGLCLPDESLSAWRREVRRLLWLEWRHAWRVMALMLVAFGVYLGGQFLLVQWGSHLVAKEFPFVMALVAFLFGAFSFQAQQSGQRFRDLAGHGATPAAIWIVKQMLWLTVTLVTMFVMTVLAGSLGFGSQPSALEGLWRPLAYGLNGDRLVGWLNERLLVGASLWSLLANLVLVVGLCFGVGQLVSLLIGRAVTAAAVGFVLVAIAFGWQQLTAWIAIPSGLAVLPLVVGLLAASAVRMTDWLEERNSIRGWLRVFLAFAVPSLVTLIGVPIYRVAEVPSMISAIADHRDLRALEHVRLGVLPEAKKTAEWWMRLAESLEDEPIYVRKVLEAAPDSTEPVEKEDLRVLRHLAELRHELVTLSAPQNRDWLSKNARQLDEILRLAPGLENCAFDEDLFESSDDRANLRFRKLSQLAALLKVAADVSIAEGKLDDGLLRLLALLRLSEHMQQNALFWAVHNGEQLESATWQFLAQWARHPAQTGDSLRAALGRPATAMPHPLQVALKKHVALRPPPSQVVVMAYAQAKRDIVQHWPDYGWPVTWMFWERQRYERLLDYSAAVAMADMHSWLDDSEYWQGDDRFVKRTMWVHEDLTVNRKRALVLQSSTWNPSAFRQSRFLWGYGSEWQRANERGEASAWRRGFLATLALRAFQLDHGRWPTQWDELIGPYLDRVPVDPWTGVPFDLRPQGYPFEVVTSHGRVPANVPLFTSRGPHGQHLQLTVDDSAVEGAASQPQWMLVSPYLRHSWPPSKDERETALQLLAFPLLPTK